MKFDNLNFKAKKKIWKIFLQKIPIKKISEKKINELNYKKLINDR